MTVTVLTDEQRAPFREAAKQVRETFIEMVGKSGEEVLEGFEADIEASRERVGG